MLTFASVRIHGCEGGAGCDFDGFLVRDLDGGLSLCLDEGIQKQGDGAIVLEGQVFRLSSRIYYITKGADLPLLEGPISR